ncbi:MAG TPA: bifunctional phosphoribosyl-AMP cyclohydrolase/phosphoribosyl-ATP diphosphatase HisIE [Ornithinimicrobium sp.]|uniref:bifunctional phosphoribosyl-AMP cyclohydrolase/phosphoribosyl-ATP diphosphatase HisIE n=1 Tax=Ornithinimicrobium sp. TaxID=1977084 RepID=UPI002B45A8B0|nr:bifunctional phosphoribosyl-AMP cyclohydrolase/phosphoribosyl-ATP diphosphatase HisIE [Ornithinimicrobium sp.]HKJ11768.1 bifunctional phosphoribosyl-AMP cyclohydrolase/phosphoribosyl-ATP diphosphatase HisIE [Ornithinimicrobium sp.]
MSPGGPLRLDGVRGVEDLAFEKSDGLIPAVVQDADTGLVLMVGFCDEAAVRQTLQTRLATFYSRSRGREWVKGETSGNTLTVVQASADCDADTLLLRCRPAGPTCHTGSTTCFGEPEPTTFLAALDQLVRQRAQSRPTGSYTTTLLEAGVSRVAQKVGEEGVETALAAVGEDDATLLGESADLVYHLLVLLRSRGLGWADVERVLAERHSDRVHG